MPSKVGIAAVALVVVTFAFVGRVGAADEITGEYAEELRKGKKFKEFEALASTAYERAYRLFKGEKYYDAAVKFKEVVLLYPSFSKVDRATFMMGEAYYQAGMYTDAASAFNRILKNFPQTEYVPRSLYRLELSSLKMERYNAAVGYYEQLIRNYPNSPDVDGARYFAGLAFYSINDFENAKRTFTDIPNESEYYGFGQYSLALCYLREGMRDNDLEKGVERAIGQLENIFRIKHKSPLGRTLAGKAHVTLGQLHYQAGRYDEAEDEFNNVSSRDSANYDNAVFGLGWVEVKRAEQEEDEGKADGHFRRAGGLMKRITDHMEGSEVYAEAWLTLAHCYLGQGKYDQAINTYEYVVNNFSLAAEFAGDPQVAKILEGIIAEVENVKRVSTALQELNKIAKEKSRSDVQAQVRLEQQEVNRLVEDLNDLELWFTGRSITGGNVMLGADYGLATISFRGAQEVEKELLSYDEVMVEKLGAIREEKTRFEKEVHIHELRKEQIIIGQKDEQLETPEQIYRREIQKYNVISEQTSAEPGETGVYRPTYVSPAPTVTPGAGEGEPGLAPEEAPAETPPEEITPEKAPAETPPEEITPEEAPAETPPEEASGEEGGAAEGAEESGAGEAVEEELPEPGAESGEEFEE
ncbi:MAG TPA: tetratricopeptide repeat protein [bacterium]|nr:tetratricopeptide repeat protein [bacterium]